ncbi:hypothetical protein SSP531S_21860 [Streptomyces spongiicola]|uniref:Uncharacterized protein n=1 Tax=Streptomyces spongiicola TaxID=1690221 RepID=A0A388T0K0_9ACTN|nr:hypothetical protein SSP531S_21860 [Streptomyces spongiicola]
MYGRHRCIGAASSGRVGAPQREARETGVREVPAVREGMSSQSPQTPRAPGEASPPEPREEPEPREDRGAVDLPGGGSPTIGRAGHGARHEEEAGERTWRC